jgi:hypothetical protein
VVDAVCTRDLKVGGHASTWCARELPSQTGHDFVTATAGSAAWCLKLARIFVLRAKWEAILFMLCERTFTAQVFLPLTGRGRNHKTKIAVSWNGTPCSLLEIYRRFVGACCLHFHGGVQNRISSFGSETCGRTD